MVGIGEARWDGGIKADHFDNILKISQTASLRTGETALATDILLFSLLNGALPLYDVATIRTEQTENFDGESLEIVRRNSDPRRKYLFNLHQTALTPRQLQRKVTGMLLQLLKPTLPEAASTVNDLLSGYWAYAALRCGATPGETLAILGATPHSLPTLLLGKPEEITTDRKAELIRTVANTLTVNPVGWYAMRIRPGVKVTEIEERLDTLDSRLHRPQLFYPHEEIARRTGKKLEFKKRPVIKDVLFFRSRLTEILPLFARIGDLAWCYTTTGRPGAPYAMIPQGAFNRFQEAIGQFTPDYEVAPIGTLELREGDRVEVLGGLLNGQEFDLKKVDSRHAANSIYRLHFDAANGIEWRVSLDSRQLRRSHPAM